MKGRCNVLLNGVSLLSLDENIIIRDISYQPPEIEHTVTALAGRNGGIVTGKRKAESSVVVTFGLYAYSTQARNKALQTVVSWAKNGGILETSDRPDQYLDCVCTGLPSVNSVVGWTDDLSITFTAYAMPFWQSLDCVRIAATSSNSPVSTFIPGNDKTLVDAVLTATGSVTEITVTAGETSITLSGLTLSSGDVVTISHDSNYLIRIRKGNDSLLANRTSLSSDDLEVMCGQVNSFSVSSGVTAEFSVKGVWH